MTWGFMNVSRSSSNILEWRKECGFHNVVAKPFKRTGRTWDGAKCFFFHAVNKIKANHFIGILCFINRKKTSIIFKGCITRRKHSNHTKTLKNSTTILVLWKKQWGYHSLASKVLEDSKIAPMFVCTCSKTSVFLHFH